MKEDLQIQLEILQFAIANTDRPLSSQLIAEKAFENASAIYHWRENLLDSIDNRKLQMKKQIIREAVKNTEPLPLYDENQEEFLHTTN